MVEFNNKYLQILLLFLLASCDYSRNNSREKNLIKDRYWNIIVLSSDSIKEFNNQPLYIKEEKLYFYNWELGEYIISKDTLTATAFNEDSNKSAYKKEISFLALINKLTKDSLKLKIIESCRLPFLKGKEYQFYNDSLNYDASLNIEKIVFSTRFCDECSAIVIEINKNGKYYYYGNQYAKLKGLYVGSIANAYFKEIEELIRMNNIFRQQLISNTQDEGLSEIIVYFRNGKREIIKGCLSDFPPRLQELSSKIYTSVEHAKIKQSDIDYNFETTLLPKYYEIPSPPPKID